MPANLTRFTAAIAFVPRLKTWSSWRDDLLFWHLAPSYKPILKLYDFRKSYNDLIADDMPHRQPAISSSFTPYRSGLPTHVVVDRCGAVARGRAPGVTTHVVVERGVATRVGDRAPGVASHRVFEGPLLRLRQRSVAGQRDNECEDETHHATSLPQALCPMDPLSHCMGPVPS